MQLIRKEHAIRAVLGWVAHGLVCDRHDSDAVFAQTLGDQLFHPGGECVEAG